MKKKPKLDVNACQKSLTDASSLTSENRFLHRLHCVILIGQGCSYSQVSQWFGENQRTIERWVKHAREFGIEGLKDEQKTGRPTKIRDDQHRMLKFDLTKSPSEFGYNATVWNGSLIKVHLRNNYQILLGLRQCQRIMHDFKYENFSPIYPSH